MILSHKSSLDKSMICYGTSRMARYLLPAFP